MLIIDTLQAAQMRQAQENARQAYNQKIAEQQLQSMRAISANGGYSTGTPVPSTPQMLQDQNADGSTVETSGGQQQQMTPQSARANGPRNGAMLPPGAPAQSPSAASLKLGQVTGVQSKEGGVSVRVHR